MGNSFNQIGSALFGAGRQAVLRILFGDPSRRFYERQIIGVAGVGSGAVQRELANLSSAGIVTRTKEGKQVYFQANVGSPVFPEIEGLVRKTFGIPAILQDALSPMTASIRVAFIYGSVASGRASAASDVDVMVVGDTVSLDAVVSALSDAQKRIGREVNPSVYATREFVSGIAEGRHFLSSVVHAPMIFLIGSERDFQRLGQVRVAEGAQAQPRGDRKPLRPRRSRS
jgi:predicted nucleotidyltransferase